MSHIRTEYGNKQKWWSKKINKKASALNIFNQEVIEFLIWNMHNWLIEKYMREPVGKQSVFCEITKIF